MPTRKWGSEVILEPPSGMTGRPAFTRLGDGGFALAWVSFPTLASTNSDIRVQRFDAFGNKVGAEVVANTTLAGVQTVPYMAALDDGGFVAVWEDQSQTGGDTSGSAIRGQRFNSSGAKVGAEFRANTSTQADQTDHSVVGLVGGGFVVTWTDKGPTGDPAGTSVINFQRYNANGATAGIETQVNNENVVAHNSSSVAALTGGGFVVAWSGENSLSDGGDRPIGIHARIFDALGNTVGDEFIANTTNNGDQGAPCVAGLAGGGFVVTWFEPLVGGGSIFAQVFDAIGAKVGDEFQANASNAGVQGQSDVAALPDGGFVVVYGDGSNSPPDTDQTAIRGRTFDALGNPIGAEFIVNTTTQGAQLEPEVTALRDGRVIVGWTSIIFVDDVPVSSGSAYQIIDPRDGVVTGSIANDLLLGHDAVGDEINGYDGNDTLRGLNGNDQLHGGVGNDIAFGGNGDDSEFGSSGNDILIGDLGEDELLGHSGGDELRGGAGADMLLGGAGIDVASYLSSPTAVTVSLDGSLVATGEASGDSFASIENLIGSSVGGDLLRGSSGANTILGNGGNDTLNGVAGDDRLFGGQGADSMTGGTGNDQFLYTALTDVTDNILDFSSNAAGNNDVFALKSSAFGGLPVGALAANRFEAHSSPLASAATTRFIYETDTRILRFDSNGSDAGGTIAVIAGLQAGATMTFADILIT